MCIFTSIIIYMYIYIYTRKGLSNAKKNTRHTSIMYAFHGQIGCTKQWLAGKQWPRNQCCAWWPLTTRSHSSRVITLDTEDPSSFQSWWSCCFGALQKNWKRTIGHWFVYPCGMVFGMVSITEEGFHLPSSVREFVPCAPPLSSWWCHHSVPPAVVGRKAIIE